MRKSLIKKQLEAPPWQKSLERIWAAICNLESRLQSSADEGCKIMPASHARILSRHGEKSRDWETLVRLREDVAVWIEETAKGGDDTIYIVDVFPPVLIMELESLGYAVSRVAGAHVGDNSGTKTRVSW